MHKLNRSVYTLAICLSGLAGFVDAVGFLHLGGYFISFMSGNSTRLAVNLIENHKADIALVGSIIALFVTGTTLGVLVRHFTKAIHFAAISALVFVTALITAAAISSEFELNYLAISLIILAMGAENAIFQRNGDVAIGLTYMTGTLVRIGQRLASAILGGGKFTWVPYFLLWLGLIIGGIIGTISFHYLGLRSIWVAAIWATFLSITAISIKDRLTDLG